MLVADVINEVILSTDIIDTYGFVVNLRENVLNVGQQNIKLRMTKVTGFASLSIKRVLLAEEEVNRCRQEEPFLL